MISKEDKKEILRLAKKYRRFLQFREKHDRIEGEQKRAPCALPVLPFQNGIDNSLRKQL